MFTPQELADLKKAFDSAGQGLEFVNMLTLKTLFAEMDIHPTGNNKAFENNNFRLNAR